MNHYTDSPLETQLNFESKYRQLKAMLDTHLHLWQLKVFQQGEKFILAEIKSEFYVEEISKYPDLVTAYRAALELVPDIMFYIMSSDEDEL